jgi:hypothetical protein
MIDKELIAPCGMNCAICSRYLAYKNDIPVVKGKITHCVGCRKKKNLCSRIKRCKDNKKIRTGEISFCYECDFFPCDRIEKLDNRYRSHYDMSMIENLMNIKKNGIRKFISAQNKKYKCPECYGLISVHSKICFKCNEINSWKK